MQSTILQNITLTAAQEKYVRENYNRQSSHEMARHLSISQPTIWNNMQFMGLKRVQLGKPKKPTRMEASGYFDVDAKSCWV